MGMSRQIRIHPMKFVLSLWIGLVMLLHAQERTWMSEDGKKIVGELLREAGDAVVLKVKDKEFTVPLSRLSEEDREWLAGRRKQMLDQQKEFASLGGSTKTFAQKDGQQVTFHVYYPTSYKPENPPPMLILFSASGQGKGLLGRFTESCEKLGWVGVGCDTFRNNADDMPYWSRCLRSCCLSSKRRLSTIPSGYTWAECRAARHEPCIIQPSLNAHGRESFPAVAGSWKNTI